MFKEGAIGAIHLVETGYWLFNISGLWGHLLKWLLVQLCNRSREDKNNYVISYLWYLVTAQVFDIIEVWFYSVCQTQEDVDQC